MVVMLAPPVIVDPPALAPPAHGIVASAQPAPAALTSQLGPGAEEGRWEVGIAVRPLGCTEPSGVRYDCTPVTPTIAPGTAPLPPIIRGGEQLFSPLRIAIEDHCDSKGYNHLNFVPRVRAALEVATSKAIERDLWTGSGGAGGFFLTDAATLTAKLTAPIGGVDPIVALAALSQALASCGTGAKGMIHFTAATAELAAVNLTTEGQRLVTKSRGDIVVVGTGYTGTGPVGDAQATPPAGTAWAFATSGVFSLALSDTHVLPDTLEEALDRRTNTIFYAAERYSIVYGNECCTYAILVNTKPADSV